MPDPRYNELAQLLVRHSTRLEPGDQLLIESFDVPDDMTVALVRAAAEVGAHPHVALRSRRVMRSIELVGGDDCLSVWGECDRFRMEKMDAYIALRGAHNVSEGADIPVERIQARGRLYDRPVHSEQRVNHTRWCVLRWPTPSMAQLSQMSTEAFEDFYFRVCTLDYARMAGAIEPLAERMRMTDRVEIRGPGDTELSFSIRDIPVIPCSGAHNVPDGECFTAPVRDSVNGVIHYNTPTIYNGVTFENVRLEFRQGEVVHASADGDDDTLQAIFATDDGARYVGEFAVGFHPHILEPMKDILFDEKIAGSIHFTPGRAYEDADNGNRSEIHWDLVLIQRPEYGGGELMFDGEVVRRDGIFVADGLQVLNPDQLG